MSGCVVDLQTKVPEDYMKFYNHGEVLEAFSVIVNLNLREGSFEALVKTAILLPIAIYSYIHD